jgi:hypothetical protein
LKGCTVQDSASILRDTGPGKIDVKIVEDLSPVIFSLAAIKLIDLIHFVLSQIVALGQSACRILLKLLNKHRSFRTLQIKGGGLLTILHRCSNLPDLSPDQRLLCTILHIQQPDLFVKKL